jgi:tetraacyldisaccharide 4'-kinase
MKSPRFWQNPDAMSGRLLQPLGWMYRLVTRHRIQQPVRYASCLPVICVGNVTIGGTGKTPVVHALVKILRDHGKQPAILLRGYGGTVKGPLAVDGSTHKVQDVGDEALLHASIATTIVSANRVAGAHFIEKDSWTTHIVMDDGLQNPHLEKTISLLVIDGEVGFGNERIFPAGPLRETVEDVTRRVRAAVIIGQDNYNLVTRLGFLFPVFRAELKAKNADMFDGKPVLAFAGIGRPEKFFASLEQVGAHVFEAVSFGDHHPYADAEIEKILQRAEKGRMISVTTRKDWVRLPKRYQSAVQVLDVELKWHDEQQILAFLRQEGLV